MAGYLLVLEKTMTLHDITGIISRVMPLATASNNIMDGFKACAVFPLNPDIFTDSYGEPASIHNGGGCSHDTQNHTCIAVAQDGQGSTSSTHDLQDLYHSPDISVRSHIPIPGLSTAGNGQTTGHLNSPESSDEDEGFCQMCREPFPHSNSEVVCLQCALCRRWGQGNDVDLSLVISPVSEPLDDLEAAHNTEGAAHDFSDLSPTRSIQNHSHSLTADHFSTTSVTQLQNVLEPVHTSELATHDINDDTHDLHDHATTGSAPTHSDQNHIDSASDPTESVESGPDHIASACTTGTPHHPNNTIVSSHTVDNHAHKDLAPILNDQDHIIKDLAPIVNDQYHTLKDLARILNDQDHILKDLAPIVNDQDHTHKELAPTTNIQEHTHNNVVSALNEQGHTHKYLAATLNVQDHIHIDSVPMLNGQEPIHETHEKEQLHSAPDVSESPPHSPTPELLTPPSGQTPCGLDSPESSDEDDGFCQVCREPFPHSNSEVVCLQCVLRRKWGQGDDVDLSLVIPPVTEPQDDLQPVQDARSTTDSSQKHIQDPQMHTLSVSSPTDNDQNHFHCTLEPTGDLENDPNHSVSAVTDGTQSHTHNTTISTHNVENHIPNTTVPTHNDLSHTLNTTVPTHNDESHTPNTTVPTHDISHTLNTTVPTHNDIGHTLNTTVSSHGVENHTPSTTISTHNDESHTLNTTPSTHCFENPTHKDLETTHGVNGHTHSDSVPRVNVQDHGHDAHEEKQLSAPGVPEHPPSPTPGPSTAPGGLDSESSDEDDGLCQVCREPFAHSNSEVVCLQCVLRRKWGQSGLYM
ncbi:uncharacterized protein LOC125308803 [Alosa alosa]|uniref:uncharacterized protein LOC125308803 n=1 Tax=Alosa alosa TaxID=278164 RepID=UPI002015089E|nr:uncharacterized protein LOC125308803 [Alosa alosa]XP_048121365.1 uncharacterized protein LOC125308803 [Alosa alosa]